MTLAELKQYAYIKKEIESYQRKLGELEYLLSSPSGPNLSGMPSGGTTESKTERLVIQKDEILGKLNSRYISLQNKRVEIEDFIYGIDDALLRLIFSLRFIDLKSWNQVAIAVGGANTAHSVRALCYRYLEKINK